MNHIDDGANDSPQIAAETVAVNLTDDDVLAVLPALPERQRIALYLVHLRGLGIREAARSMGISHVQIQRLLGAAQRNLAAQLLHAAEKRGTILTDKCAR